LTDRSQAIAWAEKVAKSRPPRYTDASRNAAQVILADAEALEAADELAITTQALLDVMPAHKMEVVVENALAAYRKAREGDR
jgi:hypothetical protein